MDSVERGGQAHRKAVVFGGAGFVGSHVADALSDRGYEVVLFDLKPSAYARPTQRMVVGDILDPEAVAQALQGCAAAYHFAGLADLDDGVTKPLETVRQNIVGTAILLDACVRAKVKRFVNASPINVYSLLGGFYRCSTQAAELYIEEYQHRYGLSYTILRYGTLYGPRADQRNSVWTYLREGLTEGRIRYPGTGEEVREYVHVRDAAQLSVEILAEEFANQHVIITGQHRMKAVDMLHMIREMLGNEIAIEFVGGVAGAHYAFTPYSFTPRVAKKLISNCYIDMGQGLLECLHDLASRAGGTALARSNRRSPRARTRRTAPVIASRGGPRHP
jgi:UDP-glucose 4-epimerase